VIRINRFNNTVSSSYLTSNSGPIRRADSFTIASCQLSYFGPRQLIASWIASDASAPMVYAQSKRIYAQWNPALSFWSHVEEKARRGRGQDSSLNLDLAEAWASAARKFGGAENRSRPGAQKSPAHDERGQGVSPNEETISP
jgi:hypothetical protein